MTVVSDLHPGDVIDALMFLASDDCWSATATVLGVVTYDDPRYENVVAVRARVLTVNGASHDPYGIEHASQFSQIVSRDTPVRVVQTAVGA